MKNYPLIREQYIKCDCCNRKIYVGTPEWENVKYERTGKMVVCPKCYDPEGAELYGHKFVDRDDILFPNLEIQDEVTEYEPEYNPED